MEVITPTDPEFKVVVWDKDEKIDLGDGRVLLEMRIVECHIKVDGAVGDKPVLYFVLEDGLGKQVIGGISARMFEPAMDQLNDLMSNSRAMEEARHGD